MSVSTGKKYGRLTAVKDVGRDKFRNRLWLCVCECGRETIVTSTQLCRGKTRSCGCLKDDVLKARNSHGHGASKTNLYSVWASMKQRCENPKNKRYRDYGGRGIHLCSEWMDFAPFMKWAIEHGYRIGLDIDRIDNNNGYSPKNCRFVTRRQNCQNKRDNVYITIHGSTKTISEWSDVSGIHEKVIQKRLKRKWDDCAAVFAPLNTRIKIIPPEKLSALKEGWNAPAD